MAPASGPDCREYRRLLERWMGFARSYWWTCPDRPDLGCFGSGYNHWGVQTNQKFIGACAVLAADPDLDEAAAGCRRQTLLDLALRALRFSLESHVSGSWHCTDGTRWGHTWISALGIERMMHGVEAIADHLTPADQAALRRVLVSESDWLLDYEIAADVWASTGRNRPESNLWNGALLLRTALMYPEEPHAADWTEKAHRLLVNGISVAADAADPTVLEGRPVRDRHVGANFFPHFGLDHHGYLNVGYMVICLSQAAMIHYAYAQRGRKAPGTVYHHVFDLWQVVRRFLFADGRLCRMGGDTRQRYCYCQDYLLPTLVFMADHYHDPYAPGLEMGLLSLIRREMQANEDGSFLSQRLERLRHTNPYYYTRLESDKAVCLSMAAWWRRRHPIPTRPLGDFEASVAGDWAEPEHGAFFHRSPTRIASWSWRACQGPQGLCLPPGASGLAEWVGNLCAGVEVIGSTGRRELVRQAGWPLPGGFLVAGEVIDSPESHLPEGWTAGANAFHQVAFAALPDQRTAVVLEHVRAADRRTYLQAVIGAKLNVPNDLLNGMRRRYGTAGGWRQVHSPAPQPEVIDLGSRWVNIEDAIGLVGVYGAESVGLIQRPQRQAGFGGSLYVDELGFPARIGLWDVAPGAVILDAASVILSAVDAQHTGAFHDAGQARRLDADADTVRAVAVRGADDAWYVVVAHFGREATAVHVDLGPLEATRAVDLVTGKERFCGRGRLMLDLSPGQAILARLI